MKPLLHILSLAALTAAPLLSSHAAVTPGNLLIMRVGDGATPFAAGVGTPISILELSTNGSPAGTSVIAEYALPSSGTESVTATGIDTSFGTSPTEGQVTISADGRYAVFAGYAAAAGEGTMANAAAMRVIARMDLADGTFDTTTRIPTAEAYFHPNSTATVGSNIRGVATFNGTSYYVSGISSTSGGQPSGLRYINHGATGGSVRVFSNAHFNNNVEIAGNTVYYSRYTTGGGRVFITEVPRINGILPVTEGGGGSATSGRRHLINSTTLPPLNGFQFTADKGTLFTADDDGIKVWILNDEDYVEQTALGQRIEGGQIASLALRESASGVEVFFPQNGELYRSIWDGTAFSDPVVIYSAGSDFELRGLAFVTEPGLRGIALSLQEALGEDPTFNSLSLTDGMLLDGSIVFEASDGAQSFRPAIENIR